MFVFFMDYHIQKGHVGVDKRREWVKLGCVPKTALDGAQGHSCQLCLQPNARTTVAPHHRARCPNHVFDADLLHLSRQELAVHLNVLVIIDDRMRYIFVHLLLRIDQAMACLKRTLIRAQVIHNRLVVWPRTDLDG